MTLQAEHIRCPIELLVLNLFVSYPFQCSPLDFCSVTKCLQKVQQEAMIRQEMIKQEVKSSLLRKLLLDLIDLLQGISKWAESIIEHAAK